MSYVNPYLEEKAAEYRRQDYWQEAAVERLCCDAHIDRRGPATRLLCRMLCRVGHLLVRAGYQLEKMDRASLSGTSQTTTAI